MFGQAHNFKFNEIINRKAKKILLKLVPKHSLSCILKCSFKDLFYKINNISSCICLNLFSNLLSCLYHFI